MTGVVALRKQPIVLTEDCAEGDTEVAQSCPQEPFIAPAAAP